MSDRSLRIDGYDGKYPIHRGSQGDLFLDPETVKDGMADCLCDPYGSLHFGVGSSDDFVCFDYCVLDDGRVYLDAVLNSETGSFIEGFRVEVVPVAEAERAAESMVEAALEWAADDGSGGIFAPLSVLGWNQDPRYFVRCVANAVAGGKEEVPRFDLDYIDKLVSFYGISEDTRLAVEMVTQLQARVDRLWRENSELRAEVRALFFFVWG